MHKCGILGFGSTTLTEKRQTHIPTSEVTIGNVRFKVTLGEVPALRLSLSYCAAKHSRFIGTEGV